jgi:hypothetical protein
VLDLCDCESKQQFVVEHAGWTENQESD